MSTRKIKDAKDLTTNELIYFKGHAQATYMSDGRTVEEAITTYTGGFGGISTGSSAYPVVEIETLSDGLDSGVVTINPNTFYVLRGSDNIGSTGEVIIVLGEATTGVANEYLFQFTSGSNPTKISLPDSIKFNSDFTVEANKIYQISILNGLGTVMSWDI